MGSPLLDKSKAFALRIIKICNEVKREKKESILTNQLVRSGTSIGVDIREVFLPMAGLISLQNCRLP